MDGRGYYYPSPDFKGFMETLYQYPYQYTSSTSQDCYSPSQMHSSQASTLSSPFSCPIILKLGIEENYVSKNGRAKKKKKNFWYLAFLGSICQSKDCLTPTNATLLGWTFPAAVSNFRGSLAGKRWKIFPSATHVSFKHQIYSIFISRLFIRLRSGEFVSPVEIQSMSHLQDHFLIGKHLCIPKLCLLKLAFLTSFFSDRA